MGEEFKVFCHVAMAEIFTNQIIRKVHWALGQPSAVHELFSVIRGRFWVR